MIIFFKLMSLINSTVWDAFVVAFALLAFFIAQLFLCLKTKRLIPKLIPTLVLIFLGIESFILDMVCPPTLGSSVFLTDFFKLVFFEFGGPTIAILLLFAWIIALIIKKRKAKKQPQ
ncbi:MAG: hypothetical protein IJW50_03435 [Clostridia bacterium]|nr:hypothetical protein [Clostridia bacterium]